MRPYRDEEDYWRIRQFLRRAMIRNGVLEKSWHVARLDYWRWHVAANCQDRDSIGDLVFLWETPNGSVMGVLNPEGDGEAHLQVDPDLRSMYLEDEMLAVAEEHLALEHDGQRTLFVWATGEDKPRQDLLQRRGYARSGFVESQWRCDLEGDQEGVALPTGYSVRSLGDLDELPARSWASWRGFHPYEPDTAYEGWEWYLNVQRCPLYRRDLDLVAVTPGGEIASFATFWFDDVTRSAYIEPVATVPEHLRRGLARATLTEGLRRVRRMGAMRAFVGGYEPGPNALYASALSSEHDQYEQWKRTWRAG